MREYRYSNSVNRWGMYPPPIVVISVFVLIMLGLAFNKPGVCADEGEGWYADIHLRVGKAHNRLTIGQNERATEGHDNLWESPIPEQFLIGAVRSYFYHPEWKQESPFFWRDVRPMGGLPREWEFRIRTIEPNVEVQISWDLARVKKGIKLYLQEKGAEKQIVLNREKVYSYKIAGKEKVFLIKAFVE